MRRDKLFSALLLIVFSSASFAHLEGDAKIAGPYRIEFSVLDEEITAGRSVDVAVSLEDLNGTRLPDRKLWIRFSRDDTVVLSAPDIYTDAYGVAKINYMFPAGGNYTADISIDDSAASFNTIVTENSVPLHIAAIAVVFLFIGITVGFLFRRSTK